MKNAMEDLKEVKDRLTPENSTYQYGLLYKGMIHNVTIPIVSEGMSNQLPLIGGLVKPIVAKILRVSTNYIKLDDYDYVSDKIGLEENRLYSK